MKVRNIITFTHFNRLVKIKIQSFPKGQLKSSQQRFRWLLGETCEPYSGPEGCFINTYELLNIRVFKFSPVNKLYIFKCMGKIFCVEFQKYPLKFHTKYLTHTLKDMILCNTKILKALRVKSSYASFKRPSVFYVLTSWLSHHVMHLWWSHQQSYVTSSAECKQEWGMISMRENHHFSSFMGLLYHVRNEIMYILSWPNVYPLTQVLFCCLLNNTK